MPNEPKPTLAVFGGSFNPPHVGHTLAAAYVLSAYPVTGLLVVPTGQHPFEKRLLAFTHRFRMTDLAMAALQHVEVSDIENRMAGESYTLHTLQALQNERPGVQLRLVLGTDLLPDTPLWHDFPAIERLAPPIIVQRAGYATDPEQPCLPRVSSTELRERIRAGRPVSGLVSPAVAAYIHEHGLYRDAP